ncbi:hypothetical protein VNI00_007581 [Paramarasmius palmivorus]|uniref:glutathione transferase n=2 Tax=Paramarasmius palmivorus TaxID=297713 RepID=A0AAW0D299_9AGAR
MVLKLYGTIHSPCATRVMIVLHEKQIQYELINVDLAKGEQQTAPHLAKQPFGQVPILDDNGFILYESRAICRYVAIKYANQGTKLVPDPTKDGLEALALFEQAASIETSDFDWFTAKAVYENVFKRFHGETPDPKIFSELIQGLEGKLKVYEVILGKQKYLAGDNLTLADLFHLSYGSMLDIAGSDIMSKQGPNVTRWWKEISSRPSWQKTVEMGALNF